VDISALRVAYYTNDGTLSVGPAIRRAVTEAAGILAGLGAQVVEWHPPAVTDAVSLFFGVLSADGGHGAREFTRGNRLDPRIRQLVSLAGQPRWLLAAMRVLMQASGQRHAADMLRAFGHSDTLNYWHLVEAQARYQRQFRQAIDSDDGGPFDVIICPAYATPAFPHGASRDLVAGGGYCVLYNVLGYPAGVVPVTRVRADEASGRRKSRDAMERAARSAELSSARLPVGVQVVARPWHEHIALAAMHAIETQARRQPEYPDIAHLSTAGHSLERPPV